ncbi:MAG TPA: hypothetical protein VGH28_05830 [Polyangiaceae bacterium]|jgi:hypothetical protein
MRKMVALLLVCGVAACAGADWRAHVAPKYMEVAEIHHSSCGACHTRVEPGERTRAQFEKALVRHRTRVKMTETQWGLLVDYLSETP